MKAWFTQSPLNSWCWDVTVELWAFRNASCLTFEGLMRFLLSVINLSRFREDPLRGNRCGHYAESPCHDFSKPWVDRGLVLPPSQRICRSMEEGLLQIGSDLHYGICWEIPSCCIPSCSLVKQQTFVELLLVLHLIPLLPVALVPEPADCWGCPSLLLRLFFEEPHQSLWHHFLNLGSSVAVSDSTWLYSILWNFLSIDEHRVSINSVTCPVVTFASLWWLAVIRCRPLNRSIIFEAVT